MPGMFIDVRVAPAFARDRDLARKLEEACPVDIFEARDGGVAIAAENLDECILCDLCLKAAPEGAVRVVKLYEE